ncbi:LCP family protein [Thermotalea metallivorans]|uniref:Putative transcriptional regulator YvhJ n=1 Tax=Thermotalea metallivorans TaxID=520762 RepID=A0A140L914_9FIRM|nr:LCP family protein [Thermotalea metallivorans]KXG77039.1 putative transcriptional regulator YvhJ [Thermotalea metallivorans]
MKKFFKVLIISFVCFTLVMGTGLYIFLNSISDGSGSGSLDGENDLPQGKEPVHVLILGVDTKDAKNTGVRSDTIMVATFDPKIKKIDIISIPRDTRVIIRGHKGKDKINHAHAYGGTDLAIKTVKDFLGMPIDYYVKVDYKALGKIVDDLGGVEVDVPMDMKYTDPYADPPLKINLKKGRQVLDGEKALQFVRFRKGYTDQDLGRINAQHTFLKALADKLLGPQTILKLPKLAKTFSTYVETDMPVSVITSYAVQAAGIKTEDISMLTVPGEPKQINGIWYFIPDTEQLKSMIAGIANGTRKPVENRGDHQEAEQELKSKATVEVLNGSGIAGLATKVAKQLKDEGYDVVNINNINGMKYSQTHIYDRKNKASEAKKIAKLLGVKDIETDLNYEAEAEITIIVGSDLKR